MESYGLNYSISHGNQSNRDILQLNKQIKKSNISLNLYNGYNILFTSTNELD